MESSTDYTNKNLRKYLPYLLIATIFLVSLGIYFGDYKSSHPSNVLKVAYLDVGQGDSIYIEAPNGRQMLIDSGVGPVVLSKLSDVMPFGDRSIDIIMASHADGDHIGGFASVINKYSIGLVIENGAGGTTQTYSNFESKISDHNIKKLIARSGTRITLDKERNIYFDILFPDRDVSNLESNDGSIVGKLVYGDESFMMTGDATKYTELLITQNQNKNTLNSTVLKLGHHGSKYSSGDLWLEKVSPSMAIISAGKDNRYGHPAEEVLERLNKLKIPYLSTMGKGTILMETDGVNLATKTI